MLTERLRRAIVEVYARFGVPADHVVCDSLLAGHFADLVNEEIGPDEYYSATAVNHALLYLRKRGDLPRICR